MILKSFVAGLTFSLLLLSSCSKDEPCTCMMDNALNGEEFTLMVDRVGIDFSSVQFPRDELTENCFTPVNSNAYLQVSFSENGEEVVLKMIEDINADPMSGEISSSDLLNKTYYLDEGLFAGGRFVVWVENNEIQAEFTVYGSGRPIVGSVRGVLVPKE